MTAEEVAAVTPDVVKAVDGRLTIIPAVMDPASTGGMSKSDWAGIIAIVMLIALVFVYIAVTK